MHLFFLATFVITVSCFAMEQPSLQEKIEATCSMCHKQLPLLTIPKVLSLTTLTLLALQEMSANSEDISLEAVLSSLPIYEYSPGQLNFFSNIGKYNLSHQEVNDRIPAYRYHAYGILPYKPLSILWQPIIQKNTPQQLATVEPKKVFLAQYSAAHLLAHLQKVPVENKWACIQSLLPKKQALAPEDTSALSYMLENLFMAIIYNRYEAALLEQLTNYSQEVGLPYGATFLERALVSSAYFVHEDAVRYLCHHKNVHIEKATVRCDKVSDTPITALTKSLVANPCWLPIGNSILSVLIQHGADINKGGGLFKETALNIAANAGNRTVAEILISHKAFIHEDDVWSAQRKGHTDMVKYLQNYSEKQRNGIRNCTP